MFMDPGTMVDRYRVVRELGRGGMSTVYLADDTRLGRTVALKVVRFGQTDDIQQFEVFRSALTTEARLAARLTHPGIVTIFDAFEFGDLTCVTMEYVQGMTLQQGIDSQLFQGRPALLRVLKEVAKGLDFAHSRGVVHRDIKLSNIMISIDGQDEGRAKILDFGIARESARLSSTDDRRTMIIGTLGYMSPEQMKGIHATGRSDQFSLAVLAHILLSGKQPFKAAEPTLLMAQVLMADPQLDSSLSSQAQAIFSRALSKKPDERFGTCEEFIRELEKELRPPPPPWFPPPTPPPGPIQNQRWGYWVIGCVVAVGLAIWLAAPWLHEAGRRFSSPAVNPRDELQYVWVPAISFMMGCVPDDSDCDYDEKPRHLISLTRGYWIGQTEVTVEAYQHFASAAGIGMPEGPVFDANWHNRNRPIVNVSWNEANGYCEWAGARLPTEAEWERAARSNRDGVRYPWGNPINHENANYGTDDGSKGLALGRDRWEFTSPVASFDPNGLGLYDVSGNAMEWVKDLYADKYYAGTPSVDPRGPTTGTERVLKGGSWFNGPRYQRVSFRIKAEPGKRLSYVGFRCATDELPSQRSGQ